MESESEISIGPVAPGEGGQDKDTLTPEKELLEVGDHDSINASGESNAKKRKVFPYHITSELRSLFRSGMIGVGVQYSSLIDAACQRTGLSKAQVKSWIKRTKYHQRKIMKQDEEKDKGEIYMSHDDEQMSYLDSSVHEEHSKASLYNQEGLTIYSDQQQATPHPHHGLIVFDTEPLMNTTTPTSMKRIIVPQQREHQQQESSSNVDMITHSMSLEKRARIPLVHGELSRNENLKRESRTHTIATTANEGGTYSSHRSSSPPHFSLALPATSSTISLLQRHPPALLMSNGTSQPTIITSEQQIAHEGARIFRKIERNFKKLEELGYQGFAFGINGEDTQLVHSGSISHCFTPPLVSYLKAIIVAANPPPIIPPQSMGTANATSIMNSSTPSGQIHLPLNNIIGSSTTSGGNNGPRQLYMYEQTPARIHQRTAIYDLNEYDSYDEGSNEQEQVSHIYSGGPNGKTVHVVVACDPNNYNDLDNELSD